MKPLEMIHAYVLQGIWLSCGKEKAKKRGF